VLPANRQSHFIGFTSDCQSAALTTPLHAAHPDLLFTILTRSSIEIVSLLENLEIGAGLTYVNNERLGRARALPLYHEHYRLVIASDRMLGDRASMTRSDLASVRLCLLTPDMQNRRITLRRLRFRLSTAFLM
jgi:hypothetical protein